MSLPQQQIGFKQSRKLCWDLWSLRWLKLNLSLVISFTPIGLWQLEVLLGVGCMNWKMFFFKRAKLSELLTHLSRLFHSISVDRKNELLKKYDWHWTEECCRRYLLFYAVLVVGILSNRYLRDWFLVILNKWQSFLNHRRCCKDSKPNSW